MLPSGTLTLLAIHFCNLVASVSAAAQPIPGSYIVQLQPGLDVPAVQHHQRAVRLIQRRYSKRHHYGGIRKQYSIRDWNAYAGNFEEEVIMRIGKLPDVDFVQPDMKSKIPRIPSPHELQGQPKLASPPTKSWALGRLSHRNDTKAMDYIYDPAGGNGTYVYIIDSGIDTHHPELEGRASFGYDATTASEVISPLLENVHGTATASLAIGKSVGVAREAKAIDVNVFGFPSSEDDEVALSNVLSGYVWAVSDAHNKGRTNVSVINMSLGSDRTPVLRSAVSEAYRLGLLTVASAGNEYTSMLPWPANDNTTLAVGAIDQHNQLSRWGRRLGTDYGPGVDILAPGTNVPVAYSMVEGKAFYSLMNGTSASSPLVAGLVCYFRGLEGPSSAGKAREKVVRMGVKGVVGDARGSANVVAYNGSGK